MGTLDGLRSTAKSLMDVFGTSVTVTRVTPGTYKPLTGQQAETTTATTLNAVVDMYRSFELSDQIRAADRKLLVAASDVTFLPDVDDRVTISGDAYRIMSVNVMQGTDQAVVYELQIRHDA
jgi:hypothetical protein